MKTQTMMRTKDIQQSIDIGMQMNSHRVFVMMLDKREEEFLGF